MRLIDADALRKGIREAAMESDVTVLDVLTKIDMFPTVNAIPIPCNIGQVVYYTKPVVYHQITSRGAVCGKVIGIERKENKKTKAERDYVWVHFDCQSEGSAIAIDFDKFGKDVFFSEDEAVDAMEREGHYYAD